MHRTLLEQLLEYRSNKAPVALATDLRSGAQRLIRYNSDDPLAEAVNSAIAADRAMTVDVADGQVFLNVFNPPLRMVVVGAVHIAQALAPIAAITGYDVSVIDPRSAFGSEHRFPGVNLSIEWPDEAMARFKPDLRTAVVTLTHDPKLDDPALAAALRSDAFYIGALGSKKTHAARLQRLRAAGFSEGDLARIHGPIGLAVGAKSPAEIAIAIVAQITQALRQSKDEVRTHLPA